MKKLLCFAVVLICATLLFGGCVQRYRYTYRSDQRHHDNHQPRPHDNNGPDHHDNNGPDHHDNNGPDHHDNNGPDHHDNSSPDHHDNNTPGQPDHHVYTGRDDGERAILSYVDQQKVPVTITAIEQLPNATVPATHGSAAQTLARYQVTAQSSDAPSVTVVRIVDYNPETGELALEE